jgi:hypothetical protein
MTKEEKLMDKQVDLYTKALSMAIMEVTEKCIKSDGEAITQAVTVALGQTLGASIAALTRGLPDKDIKGITDLICDLVKGAAKASREDVERMGNKN